MDINWQDIFYVTASLAMIVVFISSILLMRLFFIASKFISNITVTAQKWGIVVNDIKYFKEEMKSKISKFLLKILNNKRK